MSDDVAYQVWITGRIITARDTRVGAGGRRIEDWIQGGVVALVWAIARLALYPHQVTARVDNDDEFLRWGAQVEGHHLLRVK